MASITPEQAQATAAKILRELTQAKDTRARIKRLQAIKEQKKNGGK